MTVAMPHPRSMPDGSMLLIGVSYPKMTNEIEGTGPAQSGPKVFTYVLLKAGGTWYTSGAGRTPQAAGWGAVERWLERDGRKLEFIEIVSATERIWPVELDVSSVRVSAANSRTLAYPFDDRTDR